MTADMNVLRRRQELLSARIANTQDPFLRDNLSDDLAQIVAQIETLRDSAA